MGLSVVLEDEDGNSVKMVTDPHNLLHELLPTYDDETFICLHYIDWYGDTVFNRLQIPQFLLEWERVKNKAKSKDEQILLQEIEKLAIDCQTEPHLYVKFYGD